MFPKWDILGPVHVFLVLYTRAHRYIPAYIHSFKCSVLRAWIHGGAISIESSLGDLMHYRCLGIISRGLYHRISEIFCGFVVETKQLRAWQYNYESEREAQSCLMQISFLLYSLIWFIPLEKALHCAIHAVQILRRYSTVIVLSWSTRIVSV